MQNFLTLTQANMQGGFSTTGLAGMAFPALQAYPTNMLIENMYNQGLIENQI